MSALLALMGGLGAVEGSCSLQLGVRGIGHCKIPM